jgi:hypothetical protein
MGYQPIYGKGQHALLWAGSPAESGKITISGIVNHYLANVENRASS